jgi:hypothetical protein
MNMDAVSQLADGASFLLVTPEFLGEEKLRAFREQVKAPFYWTFNREEEPEVFKNIMLMPFSILFLAGTELVLIWIFNAMGWMIPGSTFARVVIITLALYNILFAIAFLWMFVLAILLLTARLAARRVMFAAGAALYLSTRLVLAWHSW